MMRLSRCLGVLVVLRALSAGVGQAQVATGTPPFGSFSGGPDIVNNANLNVNLSIPVVAKTGRALPFAYSLVYDSSVWQPITAGTSNAWSPIGGWGWHGATEVETGYVTYTSSTGRCRGLSPHGV